MSPVFLAISLVFTLGACDDGAVDPGADAGGSDGGSTRRDGGATGSDGGGESDAGTGTDAGPPGPSTVPVIVAVGRGGRSTISCDDGRTWIENRIETADTVRCWGQPSGAEPEFLDPPANTMPNPNYLECDHDTGNSTGLVFHRGLFIRSIGWGTPGRTQRSVDGVTWEDVPSFDETYNGLIAFDDALVAMGTPQPFFSLDEGLTWEMTSATLGWDSGHVRSATSSGYGAMGSIVFYTDMGYWWSDDRGATYHGPDSIPCDGRDFASSDDVTIVLSGDGSICTTLDGGMTWTSQPVATSFSTNPVWNGTAFHAWGMQGSNYTHFSSPDGVTWSEALLMRVNVAIVGATTTGAMVGVNGIWNGGYENQRMFRTDDGDSWETLPTDGTAFVQSHAISDFASGLVPPNAYCPGT
ncbi:MAG: hypothetical protein AB7S26_28075 [Sandaracinaceae bacterium]